MAPFIAQYSIRSKQAYIFRTNRLREVTGASHLISTAFDRLYGAAYQLGYKICRLSEEKDFSFKDILQSFSNGSLHIAELFQGGGNLTLLMNDKGTFRQVNQVFTSLLLRECPGLVPLCTGVPIEQGPDGTYDYRKDYERLARCASWDKSAMSSGLPADALPFAMLDRSTRRPYQEKRPINAVPGTRYTAESLAKLNAYTKDKRSVETASQLDDLLEKDDSMLAIVHADGNNMGKKLKSLLGDERSYDVCVPRMRCFSRTIDQIYVKNGKKAIDRECEKIKSETQQTAAVRVVISDGDDFTFICNARYALRFTRAYLNEISKHEACSSCAGICLFHRHYPFDRAYDLAEQACENAKKKVHTEAMPDECWIDFYYLHGGVPDDLDTTRQWHGTDKCIFRPWRCDDARDRASIDRLEQLARVMISVTGETAKTTRTNLKTLGAALEGRGSVAQDELERIYFRVPNLRWKLKELFPDEGDRMKALYDLSEVYDLWFTGR